MRVRLRRDDLICVPAEAMADIAQVAEVVRILSQCRPAETLALAVVSRKDNFPLHGTRTGLRDAMVWLINTEIFPAIVSRI